MCGRDFCVHLLKAPSNFLKGFQALMLFRHFKVEMVLPNPFMMLNKESVYGRGAIRPPLKHVYGPKIALQALYYLFSAERFTTHQQVC